MFSADACVHLPVEKSYHANTMFITEVLTSVYAAPVYMVLLNVL